MIPLITAAKETIIAQADICFTNSQKPRKTPHYQEMPSVSGQHHQGFNPRPPLWSSATLYLEHSIASLMYFHFLQFPLISFCSWSLKCDWTNRPLPNYLRPLFQSESRCSSFHVQINFHSHENKFNLRVNEN